MPLKSHQRHYFYYTCPSPVINEVVLMYLTFMYPLQVFVEKVQHFLLH
jgi:hypothetical protein